MFYNITLVRKRNWKLDLSRIFPKHDMEGKKIAEPFFRKLGLTCRIMAQNHRLICPLYLDNYSYLLYNLE